MRLVKQGRRKEVVDQERRRSSGIFVAQTQNYEDQRHVVVAPYEDDTVQNQPQDVLVDQDHRIFKRISDGQSTLNEDEDDPAMLKLAKEHRDLVINVTEENADVLRGFVQRNNPDLLRLRQKIADM